MRIYQTLHANNVYHGSISPPVANIWKLCGSFSFDIAHVETSMSMGYISERSYQQLGTHAMPLQRCPHGPARVEDNAVPANNDIIAVVNICLQAPMHIHYSHVSVCLPYPVVVLEKMLPRLYLRSHAGCLVLSI